MSRRLAAVLSVAALSVPVVGVVSPAEAAPAGKYFSSCTALAKTYPHGVAKNKKAARKQVAQGYGMPATSKKAKAAYKRNAARLDRDKDGTACER